MIGSLKKAKFTQEFANDFLLFFEEGMEVFPRLVEVLPTITHPYLFPSWRFIHFLGFFKTARLGVEDTLTLFSRQTLPIDGKGTVKG